MTEEDENGEHKNYGLDRTLALSDGVFAFAITLLVLDLVIPIVAPGATSMDLWQALSNEHIAFLNFFISFLIAGIWWNAHHRNFSKIHTTNTSLRMLNMLFLAWIALLPFFTKLLTEYYNLQLAVALYAFDQAMAGFSLTILWPYLTRNPHLTGGRLPPETIRRTTLRNVIVPIFFVFSIGLSFVNPQIASLSWYFLFPIYVVLYELEKRSEKTSKQTKKPTQSPLPSKN
jgi:uncharacterized membrane protein